jgi:fructan beta-fructosidase
MTLPRNLFAQNTNGVWHLVQKPIATLNMLRKKIAFQKLATETKDETISLESIGINSDVYECNFELSSASTEKVGISVLNDKFRGVEIGYEPSLKKVYINRTKTNSFSDRSFSDIRYFTAPVNLTVDKIKFKVFVDNSIVEVFVNDGESVFTVQAFPVHSDKNIKILNTTTPGSVKNLQVYPLQSIW